jgi:formylglycine-generating enzyme required for sulfatase activity
VTSAPQSAADVAPTEALPAQIAAETPPPDPAPAAETVPVEAPPSPGSPAVEPVPALADATVTPAGEDKPASPAKVGQPVATTAPVAADDGGCSAALARTRKPTCSDALKSGGRGPLMVVMNGGDFIMGSDVAASERPPHPVRVRGPLAMSVYEVTQGEFAAYCKAAQRNCPARAWPADDYPMVNVTWRDAHDYTRWLSEQTGQPYRLPSEAEWEFAARAGTTTAYPFGDDILITGARFSGVNRQTAPLPVSDRSINRNRFRLYHMVGNVREWVADAWQESHQGAPADGSARGPDGAAQRVVRGGGYDDDAHGVRSAARMPMNAGSADRMTGIRVVREF